MADDPPMTRVEAGKPSQDESRPLAVDQLNEPEGSGIDPIRIAKRGAAIVGISLVAATAILYLAQDQLIYLPSDQVPSIETALPSGREVHYVTDDHVDQVGWLIEVDDPQALVVAFHGNEGNRSSLAHLARPLAEAGYTVLLAEYRGYGGVDGSPSEAGLNRDANAAVSFLRSLPDTGDTPVVYVGYSLGTAIAVDASLRDAPDALVLLAPFTSLPAAAWESLPIFPYTLLVQDHYNTVDEIDQIDSALLIVGGTQDETVPPAHSRILYETAPEPKELVMIEGAGHGLRGPDGPRLADVVIDYLDRTLSGNEESG